MSNVINTDKFYTCMPEFAEEVPIAQDFHPVGITRFLKIDPSVANVALSKRHREQVVITRRLMELPGTAIYSVRSLKDNTEWEVFDFELTCK